MGVVAPSGGGSGARIEVDPDVLIRAGQQMSSLGSQLVSLSDALGAALSSGIASGMDPAGADFGIKYGHQAQEFADAVAMAATAYINVGYMLQATGFNYKNADAVSTIGGSGPAGGVGQAPGKTVAGHAKVGPNSIFVPPPTLWYLVEPFIGIAMEWPSGHPGLMRVTAAQWKNFGRGLAAFKDEVAAVKTAVSVQHIPEAGKIGEALNELGTKVSDMANGATQLGQAVEDFANGVEHTQDAIRRLLDRLSPEGLFDTVKGFLTGDGEKILRELGHDIGELLHNFQQQIKGCVGLLSELTSLIGDAADAFQKWIRPILVAEFGANVGNSLADGITFYTDFEVGVAGALVGTVSGLVSLADADTWKGMAELAASVAEDPTKLPGVLENMGKQFVAWDQWSGDHPGRAAGEAAFNIGSLFVPGGALTKTGSIAKGFKFTKGLFEDGKLGQLGKLGGLAGDTKKLDELGDLGGVGGKLPDTPEFKAPQGIPDSVLNPPSPHPVDVPSSPHGLEGPAGPPDPPGATGIPGDRPGSGHGDGPPPEPPGRPTEPAGAGPGRPDAPATSPTDAPHASEPTAPSPSAPTSPSEHAPESSSPPSSPESSAPPSSEPSPTSHEPSTPESHDAPASEQPGAGAPHDAPASEPSASGSPGEEHGPGTPEHGTAPDDRAPADHQPAHTAAGDPPDEHNRATSDSAPREQADAPGSNEERHEPKAANQPAMAGGGGMPMAPHMGGSGGGHGPTESHAPAGKSTSEPTGRTPEAKTPSGGSAESPRAQTPGAGPAGPGSGTSPTAPVEKAPPSTGGGSRDESRPSSEPPSRPAGERGPASSTPNRPEAGAHRPSEHKPAPHSPSAQTDGGHAAHSEPSHRRSESPDSNPAHASHPGEDPSHSHHDSTAQHHEPSPDEIPPPLVRDQPYELKSSMNPTYIGEQHPGPTGPGVRYLNEAEREAHRITIREGLVYDSSGKLFDTSTGVSAFGPGGNGRAIFVMDEHGNMYASLFQARGVFHHSSFFSGGDVAGAGELIVKDGKVVFMTDRSGHYHPGRSRTQQVLDQFDSQGVDFNQGQYFAPEGT